MATVLYARVSTAEQTIEHQLAHAKAAGFAIDEVMADNGVSGLSTRLGERPERRSLCDELRAGDVLVVRWVDRLGRNYEDVCDVIREFMRRGPHHRQRFHVRRADQRPCRRPSVTR
jgi:putative DNA-invertase from lambdoid prophage Rac